MISRISRLIHPLWLLGAVLVMGNSCLDNASPGIAGTSVSTGNPSAIKGSFKENGIPTVFSGEVSLYATAQIPMPLFQPDPLAVFPISGKAEFLLHADSLDGIPDSAWPAASRIGDSLLLFNLVASDSMRAGIARNVAFNKKRRHFEFADSLLAKGVRTGSYGFDVEFSPLISTVAMAGATFSKHFEQYLFMLGTGYYSRGAVPDNGVPDSIKFVFGKVPRGMLALNFLAVWLPGTGPASGIDSLQLLSLTSPFHSGTDRAISLDAVWTWVPLPPGYRK